MKMRTQKRKDRKYMILWGLSFLLLLFCGSVINLLTPDRALSETEKRTLTALPELSISRFISGSYSAEFESYASDQLFARDFFIRLQSVISLAMEDKESQGVYFAKNGYLIERMDPVDEDNLTRTLEHVSGFAKATGIPSTLVLVPNAIGVCSDLLPAFAVSENQAHWMDWIAERLSGAALCDLTEPLMALAEKGEQVYYRTDHHWTSLAAYRCLPAVAKALGFSPTYTYSPLLVNNSFSGSLAAKSGYPIREYDSIYIYAPDTEIPYMVTDNTSHTKSTSIYQLDALSGTDPYTVFLGGNPAHLTIQTANREGGRLLVFKDSYFNCFLPFLVQEYAEIDIIDPRYYYEDIQMLLYEKEYDSVLFFYNLNTFTQDTSLALTLEGVAEEAEN